MNLKTVLPQEAVAILRNGGVGVMPTDTVYGVVAKATNKEAVERLYALKQRERKPGTIIASSTEQCISLGIPEEYLRKVEKYWPNSLSVVLPLTGEFAYIHQGVGTVAVRVVADENLRAILEQTGPLVTSSANHPGKPGSVNVEEAWDYFKDTVDFYVDGGDLTGREPSTIIRLDANREIEVLRPGAVRL